MSIKFDVRWRIGSQPPQEFQPEFFALLQEIEASGSLLTAARTLGISYRHAWGLMREWSGRIGQPIADLQRGRGTKLTPLGVKLLWGQRRIIARLGPELESLASELNSEISGMVSARPQVLVRAFASHGLAIGILRDQLNARGDLHMQLQYRGSLDSLRLFRSGKCDIAGFHFPYGELGLRLASRYRHLLHPDKDALIHVVDREQGIITARGNPKGIGGISDLSGNGIVFVNREPGAGTRLILDALLQGNGILSGSIRGYDNEEFTHTAVAAMVASGAADAGFGIRAAAARLDLGFISLVRERYLFAVRRDALQSAAMTRMRGLLKGGEFRKAVASLPGYDASDSGAAVSHEELFD
ncbi:MAG: helix-turn-helix transcriptional regulator [Gammaproteobacteria bacterium]|nr:helix-turn-helix transcriptional regulator [Gammaproteobacteria bacterium]